MLLRALKNWLAWGTPARSSPDIFAERIKLSGPLIGLISSYSTEGLQQKVFIWEIRPEYFLATADKDGGEVYCFAKDKVIIPRLLPGFESNEWYFNVGK